MVNGSYDDCWVANSQKVFPVKAGITLPQAKEAAGMKFVFEQNGYRNTRIGFIASVQLEDGSWITAGEGECGAKNGYTFFYDLSALDGKVKDARVTLTSYATDDGSPYPGVAELELYEAVDKTALNGKLEAIGNASFDDEAAGAALARARYAASKITVSKSFADEACAALDDAVVPAWKASIAAQAESVDASKYTDESAAFWNAEKEAVLAALDEADSFDALAALQARLDAAMAKLVKTSNKTLFRQAIGIAQALKADGALEGVNSLVAARFEKALAAAAAVDANTEAEQAEVNAAWMELCEAVQMLSFKTDKSELQALVALCDAIDLTEYAPEGQEEFTAALQYAHEVLDDEAVLTDGSIAAAIARLQAAKDGLQQIVSVDTRILEFLIEQSDALDLEKYVEAGKPEFIAALDAAKAVLADPQNQQRIDEAVNVLSDAYLNLRLKADEDLLAQLKALADKIDALNLDELDADTAASLKALRKEIGIMLSSNDVAAQDAQALIDKTNEALNQAGSNSVQTAKPAASSSVKTGLFAGGWTVMAAAAAALLEGLCRKRK